MLHFERVSCRTRDPHRCELKSNDFATLSLWQVIDNSVPVDNPNIWKQTILERRLRNGLITVQDFKEQHPLGEDAEPRENHHQQEFDFGEYIQGERRLDRHVAVS